MGNVMARLLPKRRAAVLMLGLENSGKTTILYKLLTGENILPVPTFGFNMEVITFDDIELDVMDVGGDVKIVPLWKHYLTSALAVIYVVDCHDVGRMEENKTLIADIVARPERQGIPLLVVVNKTDSLDYNLSSEDLNLRLDLPSNCKLRQYKVQMVSAETGDGLAEAFTWLCATLGSGNANRKLKRTLEAQAKKKRNADRIKQRTKQIKINAGGSDLTTSDAAPIKEESVVSPPTAQSERHPGSGSIDDDALAFDESYARVNAFFTAKASEFGKMMTGEDRRPAESLPDVTSSETPGISVVIDTISSNPHLPVSPRRPQSTYRLLEFMDKQSLVQSVQQQQQQQQQETSSCSATDKSSTANEHLSATAQTTFTKVSSFLHVNSTMATAAKSSPSERTNAKQPQLGTPGDGPAERANTLPNSVAARLTNGQRVSKLRSKESATLPRPSAPLKAGSQPVLNVDKVDWKDDPRREVPARPVDANGSLSPKVNKTAMETSPESPDRARPGRGFIPAVLSVFASIRVTFSGSRNDSRYKATKAETGIEISKEHSSPNGRFDRPVLRCHQDSQKQSVIGCQ